MAKFRVPELVLVFLLATAIWATVFAVSANSPITLATISPAYFKSHWQDVKDFFDSAFFMGIIGAGAAAPLNALQNEKNAEKSC